MKHPDNSSRIKVYKTDVSSRSEADNILHSIQKQFREYDVSIDLEDCDKVMRIESLNAPVDDATVKTIVSARGHHIERLPAN